MIGLTSYVMEDFRIICEDTARILPAADQEEVACGLTTAPMSESEKNEFRKL